MIRRKTVFELAYVMIRELDVLGCGPEGLISSHTRYMLTERKGQTGSKEYKIHIKG